MMVGSTGNISPLSNISRDEYDYSFQEASPNAVSDLDHEISKNPHSIRYRIVKKSLKGKVLDMKLNKCSGSVRRPLKITTHNTNNEDYATGLLVNDDSLSKSYMTSMTQISCATGYTTWTGATELHRNGNTCPIKEIMNPSHDSNYIVSAVPTPDLLKQNQPNIENYFHKRYSQNQQSKNENETDETKNENESDVSFTNSSHSLIQLDLKNSFQLFLDDGSEYNTYDDSEKFSESGSRTYDHSENLNKTTPTNQVDGRKLQQTYVPESFVEFLMEPVAVFLDDSEKFSGSGSRTYDHSENLNKTTRTNQVDGRKLQQPYVPESFVEFLMEPIAVVLGGMIDDLLSINLN